MCSPAACDRYKWNGELHRNWALNSARVFGATWNTDELLSDSISPFVFHRPTVHAMVERLRSIYGGGAALDAAVGAKLAASGGGSAHDQWQPWIDAAQPMKAAFAHGAVEFMLCAQVTPA